MNTRLRPTPYSDAHLGHAWVAYHNWLLARRSGGQFVLIFDDIMYRLQQLWSQSFSLEHAMERYIAALDWLGLTPDRVVQSSTHKDLHEQGAMQLGIIPCTEVNGSNFTGYCPPLPDGASAHSQYHPWLVMVRVIDDCAEGVNCFFRGEDLIGELQLYDHIARQLGNNPPGQQYLPVVRREKSGRKESKSSSEGISLFDLRDAGYTPRQVLHTLLECAEVSAAKQQRDVVIPDGILELGTVRALEWQRRGLVNSIEEQSGKPWGQDVWSAISERMGANADWA